MTLVNSSKIKTMAKKIESKPNNMKSTLRSILATAAALITNAYLGFILFARNVNLKSSRYKKYGY